VVIPELPLMLGIPLLHQLGILLKNLPRLPKRPSIRPLVKALANCLLINSPEDVIQDIRILILGLPAAGKVYVIYQDFCQARVAKRNLVTGNLLLILCPDLILDIFQGIKTKLPEANVCHELKDVLARTRRVLELLEEIDTHVQGVIYVSDQVERRSIPVLKIPSRDLYPVYEFREELETLLVHDLCPPGISMSL
jgi:hypothetical protein